MSATETRTEIQSFHFEIAEQHLPGLRRRIAATGWPSRELVTDRTQGVQTELGRAGVRRGLPLNKAEKGGHFTAWEESELSTEVRAAFTSLR